MVMKLSICLLSLLTTSSLSNENTDNRISNKQVKKISSAIELITQKPKRVFSLSKIENIIDKNKVQKTKKDQKFIPTESISEDLSVPFPIDI